MELWNCRSGALAKSRTAYDHSPKSALPHGLDDDQSSQRETVLVWDCGFVLEGTGLNNSPPTTFVLNGVTADVSRETLRDQSNRTIAVRHQTFAVLRHLLENADRVVTKDDLMKAVWNGLAVTDDSLVQCIHEIRAALNDRRQAVVQTVPRRGYRLVLPSNAGPRMITILAAELVAAVRPAGKDERSIAAPTPAYRQIVDRLLVQHAGRVFS
ncbi:winged helix-turn-helix domain-containing protein, partial [Mesorhizobium sp.]